MSSTTATPRASGRRPVPRPALLSALLVVVAAVGLLLGSPDPRRALDPDSTGPDGARALAQVLHRRGVTIEVARSDTDLAALRLGGDTTVLVTDPAALSARSRDLLTSARDVHALVLLAPPAPTLDALDLPVTPSGGVDHVAAGCDTAYAEPDDVLGGSGVDLYRVTGDDATTCFTVVPDETDPQEERDVPPTDETTPPTLDDPTAAPGHPTHGLVDLPTTDHRPRTVVIGTSSAFGNAEITRQSHAAIATRILSSSPRLVWFVPDPDDLDPATDTPPSPTPPPWIGPSLAILALATLLLCLWRGRRLGPLVTEPLPVVVPANETTLARGRLHRRIGDPTHAARVLTDAATHDLRTALRLPDDTPVDHLATEIARHTDEPADDVLALLTAPVDETGLARHARRLRRLRRKVRHT